MSSTPMKDESEEEDDQSEEETLPFEPETGDGTITLDMTELNPFLTCSECHGYLRQAHTIMECMHTFCKVCLHHHFMGQQDFSCPKCGAAVDTADPMRNAVRFDRMMQNIVDKIVPQWQQEDNKLKEDLFGADYKKNFVQASDSISHQYEKIVEDRPRKPKKKHSTSQESSSSMSMTRDDIIFELIPMNKQISKMKHSFVKAQANFPLRSVKTLVAEGLDMAESESGKIRLTCNGEILGNDHTVEFVRKTRWHDPVHHLVLMYSV